VDAIAKPEKIIDFRKKRREILREKDHSGDNEFFGNGFDFLKNGKWKWILGMVVLFILGLLLVILRAL